MLQVITLALPLQEGCAPIAPVGTKAPFEVQ